MTDIYVCLIRWALEESIKKTYCINCDVDRENSNLALSCNMDPNSDCRSRSSKKNDQISDS